MAKYDNSYAIKITPNTPTLRGLTTNYSRDGQQDIGGVGLGDLFELDYDRNEIEKIFNQGTDAAYAVKQKENQIAQNQYANNQFASQQSAVEALRQQRNSQIASGMARGLNAAQEQGTILGIQQEGAAGALELANKRQTMADEIAAAYAQNVIDAMKESNTVKQELAKIASTLYEADVMGYTGELSASAQMDANASTRYAADRGYEGDVLQANATITAAQEAARVQKEIAELQAKGIDYPGIVKHYTTREGTDWEAVQSALEGSGLSAESAAGYVTRAKIASPRQQKGIQEISNTQLWIDALDGDDSAYSIILGIEDGSFKGSYRDADVKAVVTEAQRQINEGIYSFSTKEQLWSDMLNGTFGRMRSGV